MQKGHNFWQFKDHNSGRRHENQTNDPIFFICFSSPNCLGNSFFHLKIVKIHFHGVPPLAHSGLQNTWILVVKAARWWFCPVQFRFDSHIEESKKPGFIFSIELKIGNLRVISLSFEYSTPQAFECFKIIEPLAINFLPKSVSTGWNVSNSSNFNSHRVEISRAKFFEQLFSKNSYMNTFLRANALF